MKRSYIQLQKGLHPDTVFFLGDLFDGGREWATDHGNSDDSAWAASQRPKKEQGLVPMWRKKYGEDFWLREYDRFGKIFFEHWNDGGAKPGVGQRGRKVISSLPGNHDLGFGANIKIPVRDRFQAYFGDTNRVDVIGNHSFVSVDSVSLSAGAVEQAGVDTKAIYGPVEEFLSNVQVLKRKAVAKALRYQNGDSQELRHGHEVVILNETDFSHLPSLDPGEASSSFPTILLTHVPLYRPPGTPCGPLRERWPPSPPPPGQTQPLENDERNAISITRGYQYQNVLSDDDSKRLISTIGDVVSVFSGDDHDYCEIIHHDKNNVREITVKSMSWAMGVRKPGFLMLSMWNPVDASGASFGTHSSGHGAASSSIPTTIETHLCLLPDQISILISYGFFAVITLLCLVTFATVTTLGYAKPFSALHDSAGSYDNSYALLPTSTKDLPSRRDRDREPEDQTFQSRTSNSSTSSTSSTNAANLAPRNTAARTRSVSPAHGGYGLPSTSAQGRYVPPTVESTWEDGPEGESFGFKERMKGGRRKEGGRIDRRKLGKVGIWIREVGWSVWRVAWVVVLWYLYLARYG